MASIGKRNMLCDHDLIGVGGQKEDRDWLPNLSGMVMGCDNAIDDSIMAACDHELNQICDDICSALTWTALWTKDNTEAKLGERKRKGSERGRKRKGETEEREVDDVKEQEGVGRKE